MLGCFESDAGKITLIDLNYRRYKDVKYMK